MRAARALVLAAAFATFPSPGWSAELTDVADGPTADRPVDLSFDVRFHRSSRSAHVLKEYHEGLDTSGLGGDDARIIESRELTYQESTSTLELAARVGVGPNLEFSAGVPLVLARRIEWGLPSGKSEAESLIATNEFGSGVCPGRSAEFGGWHREGDRCVPNEEALDAIGDANFTRAYAPLFDVPGKAHFSGFGDPWLGFTVGLLEEEEDGGAPAWILGVRYQVPLAPIADPSADNTEGEPGGVGSGFHRVTARTALSKRFGVADPYVELQYTLSFAGGKAYSNCDHPETLGTPENCARWSEDDTGAKPRHVGGLTVGTELTAWAEPRQDRRFWFDARVGAEYHSEGRDYSEATWMLEKLTYTEDFARVTAKLRVAFDGGRNVQVGLETGVSWDSPHFLTRESIGEDLDQNGQVDLDNVGGELNPNFDFRHDVPGRRLRIDDVLDFGFGAFARVAL